eukprot:2918331-Pyramimonas_sp.AAC.1
MEQHVCRTWPSPSGAAGRALAARVRRGPLDMAAIVLYFPPQPRHARLVPHYKETVRMLTQWYEGGPTTITMQMYAFGVR